MYFWPFFFLSTWTVIEYSNIQVDFWLMPHHTSVTLTGISSYIKQIHFCYSPSPAYNLTCNLSFSYGLICTRTITSRPGFLLQHFSLVVNFLQPFLLVVHFLTEFHIGCADWLWTNSFFSYMYITPFMWDMHSPKFSRDTTKLFLHKNKNKSMLNAFKKCLQNAILHKFIKIIYIYIKDFIIHSHT